MINKTEISPGRKPGRNLRFLMRYACDDHFDRFLFAVRKPDRNLCCSLFLCFNFSLLVDGCDPFVFALKGQLPV